MPATTFNDLLDKDANETAAEFVRRKIRQIVNDPAIGRSCLSRRTTRIGTKRSAVDTDYFETFNRDNVTLVDVRSDPIEEITPTGLRTDRRPTTSSTSSSSPPASTP